MDVFNGISRAQCKTNSTFQNVYIAERFLRHRNAPEAPVLHPENSPTVAALSNCNLAFRIEGEDMDKMKSALMVKARDSGTGVNISFMDFGCFETLLNALRDVGENYTQGSLAPLSEYIHAKLTAGCEEYFLLGKSMLKKGPIKTMTEIIRPFGVTSVHKDLLYYVPNMERIKTSILTHGTNMGRGPYSLKIPVDKVAGLHKLESCNNYGQPAKLYLVVGPSDELHCGDIGDTLVEKSVASQGTHVVRSVSGKEVVDQAYTVRFFFGQAGDTALGILEDAVARCRAYTKVSKDATVYRELAVIQIGLVPYGGPNTVVKNSDESGRITTIQIDNYQIKAGPEWTYTAFQY